MIVIFQLEMKMVMSVMVKTECKFIRLFNILTTEVVIRQ